MRVREEKKDRERERERKRSFSTLAVLCLPSFANKSWLEWNRIAVLNRAAIFLSFSPLSIRLSPSDTSLGAEFFFATFQKMNSAMRLYGRTNFRISVLPGFLSLFFFFPLFFFFFLLSLSWTREGRKEGKQSLDRWREVKGEERAEVLEDGQAFLDRRQKTSRLGKGRIVEKSWTKES